MSSVSLFRSRETRAVGAGSPARSRPRLLADLAGIGLLSALLLACNRQPAPAESADGPVRVTVYSARAAIDQPQRVALPVSPDEAPRQTATGRAERAIPMTPDAWIVTGVRRELDRIPGAAQHRIGVSSDLGVVVLTGTVPTESARELVLQRVAHVRGVRTVTANLDVVSSPRSDRQLAEEIRTTLNRAPLSSPEAIRVRVEQGLVRLEGSAPALSERQMAEQVALAIPGVREVDNRILLTEAEERPDDEIAERVVRRMAAERLLRGAQVAVRVSGGAVFLSGEVKSAFERRLAREAAWGPGVYAVYDDAVRVVLGADHLRQPQPVVARTDRVRVP